MPQGSILSSGSAAEEMNSPFSFAESRWRGMKGCRAVLGAPETPSQAAGPHQHYHTLRENAELPLRPQDAIPEVGWPKPQSSRGK